MDTKEKPGRDNKGRFLPGNKVGIPFETGNKIGEIYTEQVVIATLKSILATLTEGSEDANNNLVRANDIKLAGEVRLMHGVTKQKWHRWQEQFSYNPDVCDLMETISEILECRLIYSGTQMDSFILKNAYGYKDVRQQEVSGKDGKPLFEREEIDFDKVSTTALLEIINAAGRHDANS